MSLKDSIYKFLPVALQNIAVSWYGYRWNKRRFGGIYPAELIACKQREHFSEEQWKEYQTDQLRKILLHAFDHVPFYRLSFLQAKISRAQLSTIELNQLNDLPVLEKEQLRAHGTSTLLSKVREPNGEYYASSGSTGTPTSILFSAPMHQRWSALFESRIRNWAGLSIQDARGMIGGRRILPDAHAKPPFYRYNAAEKQVYFSAYHINAAHAADYVEGMIRHQIQYMTGYAMSNYLLARFIEEQQIQAPELKAVITSSEKLTREMRDTFRRVYRCKSYDSYSGLEACGLISECEFGNLHMSPDAAIIELIKEDGTYAGPGESGEAICTGFLNYDQPLIRYRIGDVIKLSENQSCECGRHMPVVASIVGRTEDVVIGEDGREMVRFHGIFLNIQGIVEGQIIQHTLTDFEIKLVLAQPLRESDMELMKTRMKSQLGEIRLRFTETNQIPRNRNGKFPAVISYIERKK